MALERRLAKLEAVRGCTSGDMERDAEAFTAQLDKLAAHVRASGDFADPPNASPAERYVRASLRGDDAMAGEILGAALEA